ncbi:MAG: hypothetical protein K1X88_05095, partial [Nannocystaceae bacterium]|nr:hypothetical protein [Nannocystaceae bacterium]
MSTLETYLDILRQTGADLVQLEAGQPVAVVVQGRKPAVGGAPVSGRAIAQIAEGLLTPAQLHELAAPKTITYEHAGEPYVVQISRRDGELCVAMRHADRDVPMHVQRPEPPRAAAQPEPSRAVAQPEPSRPPSRPAPSRV